MSPSPDIKVARPLSPHIQIYKPQLTSILSISHRLTGVALSVGLIIFVAWLAALADGFENYTAFTGYLHSILGQLVLFGMTIAFFFHLCCGIRHLLWDCGLFLEIKEVYNTGYIALGAAVVLTAIVWLRVYGVGI
jgi:succinate dehydrogenase / fumarate reductase cytochrome b subunit